MNKINTKHFISELKRREISDIWIVESNHYIGTKYFLFNYYKYIKDYNKNLLETVCKANNIIIHTNDEKFLAVLKLFDDIKFNDESIVSITDLYIKEQYGSKNKWYRLLKFKDKFFKLDDFLCTNIVDGFGYIYSDNNESLDHILITNINKDYLTICKRVEQLRGL